MEIIFKECRNESKEEIFARGEKENISNVTFHFNSGSFFH